MENKNCCDHDHQRVKVCVHVDGCCTNGDKSEQTSCTCVPVLNITIGEGGQFVTLTEALEYAGTIVHNTLFIEMLSDVTETGTETIWVNGFGDTLAAFIGPKSFILKGNGYKLNLNSIIGTTAIGFFARGMGWIDNVTILAENVTSSAIAVGTYAFVYIRKDVKVIGNALKNIAGFDVYWGGGLNITYGNSVLENFKYGIKARSMGTASVYKNNLTFTNVTTNYYPAQNTVGNGNAYIHVE